VRRSGPCSIEDSRGARPLRANILRSAGRFVYEYRRRILSPAGGEQPARIGLDALEHRLTIVCERVRQKHLGHLRLPAIDDGELRLDPVLDDPPSRALGLIGVLIARRDLHALHCLPRAFDVARQFEVDVVIVDEHLERQADGFAPVVIDHYGLGAFGGEQSHDLAGRADRLDLRGVVEQFTVIFLGHKLPYRRNKDMYRTEDYHFSVGWSEEDQLYIGRVDEFPSLAAHGNSQTQALEEIKEVVRVVLEDLTEEGAPIPEPLSKHP
jgi:predicted RNase H-like HicB family nuclease